MKRQIQAKIYEETKDMTTEEVLAYFNKSSKIYTSPIVQNQYA